MGARSRRVAAPRGGPTTGHRIVGGEEFRELPGRRLHAHRNDSLDDAVACDGRRRAVNGAGAESSGSRDIARAGHLDRLAAEHSVAADTGAAESTASLRVENGSRGQLDGEGERPEKIPLRIEDLDEGPRCVVPGHQGPGSVLSGIRWVPSDKMGVPFRTGMTGRDGSRSQGVLRR